jgi:hypothetical protein
VIQEAKRMANEIQQWSDLWDLEHYLTQRRKGDRPQVRLSVFATHARLWETPARKPTQ